MCKTGKKITINIFGSIEDMIFFFVFFCDIVVSRTNEKKQMNEKKKLQWRLDGLLPIFQFGSRYNRLYRDTTGLGARQGAQYSLAGALGRAAGRCDMVGLATRVCRDTIVCIVIGRL